MEQLRTIVWNTESSYGTGRLLNGNRYGRITNPTIWVRCFKPEQRGDGQKKDRHYSGLFTYTIEQQKPIREA